MEIGERIRQIRKEKNITQEELASKLNVKRSVISKYENGSIGMRLETLEKIAEIFEIDPVYLLFGEEFTPETNNKSVTKADLLKKAAIEGISFTASETDIERLEKALHKLNDNGKEKVADYAELLTKDIQFTE